MRGGRPPSRTDAENQRACPWLDATTAPEVDEPVRFPISPWVAGGRGVTDTGATTGHQRASRVVPHQLHPRSIRARRLQLCRGRACGRRHPRHRTPRRDRQWPVLTVTVRSRGPRTGTRPHTTPPRARRAGPGGRCQVLLGRGGRGTEGDLPRRGLPGGRRTQGARGGTALTVPGDYRGGVGANSAAPTMPASL